MSNSRILLTSFAYIVVLVLSALRDMKNEDRFQIMNGVPGKLSKKAYEDAEGLLSRGTHIIEENKFPILC